MLKIILIALLPLLVILTQGFEKSTTQPPKDRQERSSGTMEKMIVANGSASIDLDVVRLSGTANRSAKAKKLQFEAERDSFFTIIVFDKELRGPLPSGMPLLPQAAAPDLPEKLSASYGKLVIENLPYGGNYNMAVRDSDTGFVFFNVEGYETEYEAEHRSLNIRNGRLLVSPEFAEALGRSADAGAAVGQLNVTATMRPIEVIEVVDGEVKSAVLPPSSAPNAGTTPGPDVIVGDLSGLA